MTHSSTNLKENNYIYIFPKTFRGVFPDRYDKGVDCD